jgi:soluble lytic murein transglycosylase
MTIATGRSDAKRPPARTRLGTRALACAVALGLAAATAASARAQLGQRELVLYQAALEATSLGAWDAARAMAAQAGDPVLGKIVDWIDMSNEGGDADFAEIARFIRENPDWPDRTGLRVQAERRMPGTLPAEEAVAWFEDFPPIGVEGSLRYAEALAAVGREQEAAAFVRDRWHGITLSARGEEEFLSRVGSYLTQDDHLARLDTLLWDGRESEARRQMARVDAAHRALAEARLALANRVAGVDAVVGRVPSALQNDEGLIYERARWRRRADLTEGALEMLARQPDTLARPALWWTERNILTRRLFRAGAHRRAYDVASSHGQEEGFPKSQAEWVSGWIALRFLDEPATALAHFQELYDNVTSPISLARGAFWSARAYEALGNVPEAERWYRTAAEHPIAFYGQLAADRLGRPTVPALPPDPPAALPEAAAFESAEMVRAARAFHQLGEDGRAELFVRRLGTNAETLADLTLVGRLALELGRPNLSVWVGKRRFFDGEVLFGVGYPVRPLDVADGRVEPALVHGIIRRESEFDPDAVSPAGARGLMQLMPATARGVARQNGLPYQRGRLTADPDYNIRLGSTFLGDVLAQFGGSYVLAIAAYNAGPSRVNGWIERNGDPRAPGVDVIDWIESIPIYETRNYVQRVLEDVQVYRVRLGGAPTIGSLEADLAR